MKNRGWGYTTPVKNRAYFLSIIVGLIGGLISGVVKLGWEVIFPPRTIDRLTPPQILLESFGIKVQEMTYHFSGFTLAYPNFIIHFTFSIVCAIIYCFVAEIWPKVKLWQGCTAGLLFWFGAHILVMPLMGLTPPALELPFDEQLSEILGHILWMWVIEIFRRDLRNRFTHKLDPECY